MNFGDILDQWQKSGGKTLVHSDKDAEEEKRILQEKIERPQSVKKLPIEAETDLHGLTREEALVRLDTFVEDCKQCNLRKVLIIHGKGNHSGEMPVLPATVRAFIAGDRRLGASGHPGAAQGGSGATWVIIK